MPEEGLRNCGNKRRRARQVKLNAVFRLKLFVANRKYIDVDGICDEKDQHGAGRIEATMK